MSRYSTDYQDVFVCMVTKNKKNGTYVEIGSGDPIRGSNTFLLESELSWRGISVEIRPEACSEFIKKRRNLCICADATLINYKKTFKSLKLPQFVDYLQIDCNPPSTSLKVLERIPFDDYKFSIITFEHDYYREHCTVRQQSRRLLHGFRYILAVNDVASRGRSFEDWWFHPDLIDWETISRFRKVDGKNKEACEYIREQEKYSS